MSRYKYTKLRNLGSVHGFLIHTPDDRQLLDIYPIGIVRELNRMADRINKLEEAGSLALGYAAKGDLESADEVWNKAKEDKL